MKRRGRWILSGILLALFIALCYAALEPLLWSWSFPLVPTLPPTSTPRPTSTFPPTRTPLPLLPTETPTATPTPWPWDQAPTQYLLEARFDYLRQQVQVQEVITYTNTTGQPLDQIPLILEPARYPGVLYFQGVRLGRERPKAALYEVEGPRVTVHLAPPLEPGQTVTLRVSFILALPRLTGRPGPESPMVFGYTSRQTNLTDWYAFIPPHHPQKGWLMHTPWYHGEHLVYPLADFDVRLELVNIPQPFDIVTNALPVPCPEDRQEARCYHLEQARQVVFSMSPYYRRVQAQTQPDIQVEGFFFLAEEAFGRDMVAATVEALETYSALFGPYHRSRLTLVQADFPDGMEYDGLYYVSSRFFDFYNGDRASFLITIAVHETAHQWWFAQVANDQALDPWMDEALATYAEALYYEHQYPRGLDWWWTYRVDYYNPRGPVNRSIYDYMGWRAYRDAVYLRGAYFLRDLRAMMGDAAFFTFLQAYRDRWAGHIADPRDFFALVAEYAPDDAWRSVAETYFLEPPLP